MLVFVSIVFFYYLTVVPHSINSAQALPVELPALFFCLARISLLTVYDMDVVHYLV